MKFAIFQTPCLDKGLSLVGECIYLSQQIQSIKKTSIINNIETDFGKK